MNSDNHTSLSRHIIRKSAMRLIYFILSSAAVPLIILYEVYSETSKYNAYSIIFSFVFVGLFIFFLTELINREPEIILSNEGIEFRQKGLFKWTMINSFSTLSYGDSNSVELVLHFTEYADFKFDITELEIDKNELVDLVQQCIGRTPIYFDGHN